MAPTVIDSAARSVLLSLHEPPAEITVPDWAADEVDYRREPSYDTEMKTRYDPDYMPFWRYPADAINRLETREVWILKCSRAGASENCLLNPLRYAVARKPQAALYVSADQKGTEVFFDKRIKLGFGLSLETQAKMRLANRVLEHQIYFPDMDLQVAWPKNRMAFRQHGYSLILADEVSKWPRYIVGVLRKRTDNYAFSTIIGISSPDAENLQDSANDPIFVEWEQTDKRYWFMPDPQTGRPFRFEMGSRGGAGLKWDQSAKRDDDTWDLNAVRKSAYYQTPDGTIITEDQRMDVIHSGEWVPTSDRGIEGREGYHINAFYMPFKSGEFGHIASAFLEAKAAGPRFLRVFVYEFLAEPWAASIETTADDVLVDRKADYSRGERPSESSEFADIWIPKDKRVFLTQDVQKAHFWWLAREWIEGGDSGLVDFGYAVSWAQMAAIADDLRVFDWFCDYGYEKRQMEVFEAAIEHRMTPVKGNDRVGLPYKRSDLDPREGKSGGQSDTLIKTYSWRTVIFKPLTLDLIRGQSDRRWVIPSGIEWADRSEPDRTVIGFREYSRQVASEECVDGEWRLKRGHPDNHFWDCEVMQLLAATIHGLYRSSLTESGEG